MRAHPARPWGCGFDAPPPASKTGDDSARARLAPRGRERGCHRARARRLEVSLPAIEFLSEKSILGCYYGSANIAIELPGLTRLVGEGRLDLADVVSHFMELDSVEEAFERLRREEGVRTIVLVDAGLACSP